jgi:YniB-like protein
MTYDETKKKIFIKWLIGIPITFVASVSSLVSVLKMLFFALDSGDHVSNMVSQPLKNIVVMIYQNTHFLEYFWIYSPTPTLDSLNTLDNIYSLAVYGFIFVGMTFIHSARALSVILTAIDQEIEYEMIKASATGDHPRQRREIQQSISVPTPKLFSQFHTLYLAPIIVGLIVASIAKLAGLV